MGGTLNKFSQDLEKMLRKFGFLHRDSNFKQCLKDLNESIKIYMNAKELLKRCGFCLRGYKGSIYLSKTSKDRIADNINALNNINAAIERIETYFITKIEEIGKFKNDRDNIKCDLEGDQRVKNKIAKRIELLTEIKNLKLENFENTTLYDKVKGIVNDCKARTCVSCCVSYEDIKSLLKNKTVKEI